MLSSPAKVVKIVQYMYSPTYLSVTKALNGKQQWMANEKGGQSVLDGVSYRWFGRRYPPT